MDLVTPEDARKWIAQNKSRIEQALGKIHNLVPDYPDKSNYNFEEESRNWVKEFDGDEFEVLRKLNEAYNKLSTEEYSDVEGFGNRFDVSAGY